MPLRADWGPSFAHPCFSTRCSRSAVYVSKSHLSFIPSPPDMIVLHIICLVYFLSRVSIFTALFRVLTVQLFCIHDGALVDSLVPISRGEHFIAEAKRLLSQSRDA